MKIINRVVDCASLVVGDERVCVSYNKSRNSGLCTNLLGINQVVYYRIVDKDVWKGALFENEPGVTSGLSRRCLVRQMKLLFTGS